MPFIDWTTKNEVGVAEVDAQHKKLFELLNRLHESVVQGKEQSELYAILDELIEYTVVHFKTEEDLFLKYDYPGYQEHKGVHDALTRTALELQESLREGSAVLSFELLDFLNTWLTEHTLGLDQQMGPFLNDKGVF